jgi:hypothetical protein
MLMLNSFGFVKVNTNPLYSPFIWPRSKGSLVWNSHSSRKMIDKVKQVDVKTEANDGNVL